MDWNDGWTFVPGERPEDLEDVEIDEPDHEEEEELQPA